MSSCSYKLFNNSNYYEQWIDIISIPDYNQMPMSNNDMFKQIQMIKYTNLNRPLVDVSKQRRINKELIERGQIEKNWQRINRELVEN